MLMRPGPVKVSPNVEAKNTVPSSALPDTSPLWKTKAATKVVTALKNAAGRASKPSASRIPPKNSESTAHHAKKLGKGKPILAISAMNQSCGPHRPSRGKNFSNTVHRKIPVARRISKSPKSIEIERGNGKPRPMDRISFILLRSYLEMPNSCDRRGREDDSTRVKKRSIGHFGSMLC